MLYISYLKEKLLVGDDRDLIDKAVNYLGKEYPIKVTDKKPFEIVDCWIEEIIIHWNIEIRVTEFSSTSFLGKLISRQNGFRINLNRNLYTTQRRYTLAHEIAHILSYDTSNSWPRYHLQHSRAEEEFCDRVARALLLPKTLIDFSNIDLTNFTEENILMVKDIWPIFQVSPWNIINKIFDERNNGQFVAILWEFQTSVNCLKIIDYYSNLPGVFIPKNDRILFKHLLNKKVTNYSPEIAFNLNKPFWGEDLVEIGSIYKKKLFCTAFPIKTTAGSYVIQIIRVNS